jgi:hypothetical protein
MHHCACTPPSIPRWDTKYDGRTDRATGTKLRLARRWACPRAPSPSRPSSASATCSTANPSNNHSVNYAVHQREHDHLLKKTSTSPELGSDLDICSKRHMTSPNTGALTHPVNRLLPIPRPCYNHYGLGIPSPRASGMWPTPWPWPRPRLSPGKHQAQVNNAVQGRVTHRTLRHLP